MTHPGRDSSQVSPLWRASSHFPAQLILPHSCSSNDEIDKSGQNTASSTNSPLQRGGQERMKGSWKGKHGLIGSTCSAYHEKHPVFTPPSQIQFGCGMGNDIQQFPVCRAGRLRRLSSPPSTTFVSSWLDGASNVLSAGSDDSRKSTS